MSSSSSSSRSHSHGGKSVYFMNQHGERLAGRFNEVAGSSGVVIICHGYCSSKSAPILVKVARELNDRAKASTLAFDFSGNGESEGSLCFANYHKEVKDLQSAINFVRVTLRKEVTAVIGHSKGANIVLLFASTFDGDVPLIVNLAGRFDMKRGVEERFGAELIAQVEKTGQAEVKATRDDGSPVKYMLLKSDLNDRMTLDMSIVRNITISEVVTIHGTQDKVIPAEDAQMFASLIRQHELYLVEGGDHNFRAAAHSDAVARKVVASISSTGR